MKHVFFAVLLALALCAPALGAAEDMDRCVTALEKRYEAMKDFHATFEQETRLASINRVEKGAGEIWFKKPGNMLWEYRTPQAQKIILDGTNLWLYLPEDRQVMKNNYATIPQHIVVDLFRGKIDIRKKFKVSPAGPAPGPHGAVGIELVPRTFDPTVKKLTLWVDAKTSHILRTRLEDDFGTVTTLTFSGIAIDTGIPDATFSFTPPPGVEVFEPPQARQ